MSLRRRFNTSVLPRVLCASVVATVVGMAGSPAELTLHAQGQPTLVPGRNVNMVSGTKWPDGDPFLQRQNEPSIAASTRNPLHLLAGSNDYRTVDIPNANDGNEETGDAWLGLFKSFDGGQRWQTTLLPGYPQDTSAEGLASPLRGYQAGADPVVRAGTNGLFYYAGLVFDRGVDARSAIFVARFIDNNNEEDNYKANRQHVVGDPLTYLGAQIVARNGGRRFYDKPWVAVDIPRSGRTCAIPGPNGTNQIIPAGDVYVAFSSIDEDARGLRSDIMLTRSSDCGATWTKPARVSDPDDRINQGATIAIDPRNGAVQIAWRRFASDVRGQTDGFVTVRSTDGGRRFSAPGMCRAFTRGQGKKAGLDPERYFEHRGSKKPKTGRPVDVATAVDEFDQATSDIDVMFRTNAYPTMAVDGSGRIYLAWSERGFSTTQPGDARIVMSTSANGRNWTAPKAVADEAQPGHQIMPSLVFGGGRLALVYYDLREDYSGQFTVFVDDKSAIAAARKRHTLDLRASSGSAGSVPVFAPSVRVSDYLTAFRRTPGGTLVEEQVQFNPPNLPMFKQGTSPFIGDYVDLAVAPAFVPTAGGGWAFNTNGRQPVFHAVWTDNRDVRQPGFDVNGDGNPWNDYTAPTERPAHTPSVFDPTATMPTCAAENTGSRNQNIYTARLSMGLIVGSPGNSKPLSPTIQRAFVVFAQNTTAVTKRFRLNIVNLPPGVHASFDQFSSTPMTELYVATPGRSTAARSVYATSTNPDAQIQVTVTEVEYNGSISPVPLSDIIILNPDIANPDIANPDIANPDIANPDIANAEVYNPDIANPDIANPDIANPDIANPDIANPDIANPDIANPDIANPDIANPDIANPDIANVQVANPDIANPDIANPDIANPDIANPDIANPDIANPDIANASLTDVTWTMTNDGNTTAAFNVNLFLAQQTNLLCGSNPGPGCITTQLVLRKVYHTPTTVNCELKVQSQNVLLANILNPTFVMPGQGLPDQNSDEPTNATLWLAPGETAKITLRVYDPVKAGNVPVGDTDLSTPTPGGSFIDPIFLPTTKTDLGSVTPVVQQQSVDTEDVVTAAVLGSPAPPAPPIVTPLSPPVPSGATEDPKPTPLSLEFVQQPSTAQFGSVVAPTVSVAVRDQYGAILPNADVTLFLGTNPTAAVLSGATAASETNGIAMFPGLSIGAAGTGYTLVATAGQALPAVSALFSIGPASATISLGNLAQPYDGSAKTATVTTTPPGLSTSVTYNGGATVPVDAGSYSVVATVTDPNYSGSVLDTLVVSKAQATVSVVDAVVTYDGAPKQVDVTTVPPGLAATVTYNGSEVLPSAVGSYAAVATVNDTNYEGSASGTLVLTKAQATVLVVDDVVTYDGAPHSVSATSTPSGLTLNLTYDGGPAPTTAGSYTVVATVDDPNYEGAGTGILTINKATPNVTWTAPAPLTYGQPVSAAVINESASVSGTFVRSPSGGTLLGVGTWPLIVDFYPTDSANYNSTSFVTSIFVNAASATVILGNLAQVYDGTPKAVSVTTSPLGLAASVTYNLSPIPPTGVGIYSVTATVTDPNYTGSAAGTLIVSPACNPLVVTTIADAGCGSLRDAISAANLNPGPDTITFAIPGAGPHTIAPATRLPAVGGAALVIDATTQTGFGGGPVPAPAVFLDGTGLTGQAGLNIGQAAGIEVYSVTATIKGLGISGFPGPGVFFYNSSNNSVVEDNLIGTIAPNNFGVQVNYSDNVAIRRNVIAGNVADGIVMIGGTGITVDGNRIGLAPNGLAVLPNGNNGITMYDGTTNARIQNNLISGNTARGIDAQLAGASVTGLQILANTVGLDAAGAALPNDAGGISLTQTEGAVVGTAASGNTISGNDGPGIFVTGPSTIRPVIQGNRIGTDPTGTIARRNWPDGIILAGPATVGGAGAGESNLITGNGEVGVGGTGIDVWAGSDGSEILGNIIGLSATGAALGNGYSGITVYNGAANVTIGGTSAGARNVISGNPSSGIAIYAVGGTLPSTITIQGNYIGTNTSGTGLAGNGGWGVSVNGTAITVGGPAPGAGNLIAGNAQGGVEVVSGSSGVSIFSNSIVSNTGLGIDVAPAGVSGVAPVLSNIQATQVDFTLAGAGTFTYELFSNSACDPSGRGEGQTLLVRLVAGPNGTIPFTGSAGVYLTATATDALGNTSEFSNCLQVPAPPSPPETTSFVGGGGGTPFTMSCPPGSVGTALRGRAGDDIDRTELWCSPISGFVLGTSTLAGAVGGFGGSNYGATLTCPANSVITGLHGLAGTVLWGGTVVDTLGVTCTDLVTNTVYSSPTVGNASFGTSFSLNCSTGKRAVGVKGGQGGLLDRIALVCQ